MIRQKTQDQQAKKQVEHPGSGPEDGGPNKLMQQAEGHANAARRARENCKTGAEAEQELQRRRNTSGQ